MIKFFAVDRFQYIMSSVTVINANLYGPFYSQTEAMKHQFEIKKTNDVTLQDLIESILKKFPNVEELIFEGNSLAENCMIVVNGEIVGENEWRTLLISPTDRISFFQGQHGG